MGKRKDTRTGIRYSSKGEVSTSVLNQTSPIQVDVNVTSEPTLVYVSIAIALITAFFLYWNSQTHRKQLDTMQKQVNLIEREIEQRLRPWIGIDGLPFQQSVWSKERDMLYEEFRQLPEVEKAKLHVDQINWRAVVKNYGSVPAYNMRFYLDFSYEPLTRSNVDRGKLEGTPYNTLVPNNETHIGIPMAVKMWNDFQKGKELFALLYLEYYYGNYKRSAIGMLYRFVTGSIEVLDSWFEE